MADDIFGNMSDMSIDELGSSLLQRKAEREKAAAKKARKNERIQQGLALLLMGQGIMKTQYKKRMKELEDFHKFETLNNEHKVKQLNMNATILNTIGNTWNGKGGLDGFKNSDDYLRFSKEVRPFVDQKIKAMTADEYDSIYGTSTYENAMNLATESYAKKYLETDKKSGKANYLAYQDGLRELLGDEAIDLDKNELFQRAMGLSVDELTGYQRKNYQNVLAQYKAQGNLMGGFRRVLGLFNDDFKAKSGFDIFSKVTEDALAGPTIRDLNQAMNLKGMTNNIVSKALADASKSPTRWKERAAGKRFENYRKNIGELYLPQMTNLLEEGRYPSELQTDTFIGKGNWEEFMSDISPLDKENLILDTAALSLRLKEDRRFLQAVYNETEGKKADGKSFNEFRAILDDEANRTMFAAMIVTDAGFRDENWNPFNWKDETYDSFGTLTKVYNKYNISSMIGDDINVDERGSVSLPDSYIEAPKERKQAMLKSTVKDILATSATENERNIKLGGELDSEINKYFGMDSQAFIEMLAREEMTFDKPSRADLEKVGFANMFGSDNLDFQFPFKIKSEINRLNKILDEGDISKNNRIKLEEQVDILERSLLYLENKPEPESKESKKIKELQTKLEQERDDLRPTEINRIENQIQDLLKIEDSDEKKKINFYEPKATGKATVEEAIKAVTFGDKNAGNFLYRIAKAESDFGTDKNTFTSPSPNIMQVEKTGAYNEIMRRLDPNADVGGPVRRYNEKLKSELGLDLTQMSYEDLQQPIVSIAFARAYLLTVPESIPTNIKEQGKYWKQYYNTSSGKGTARRFAREGRRFNINYD